MSFKYDQLLSQEQADRLDGLMLLIEPSPEDQQEIRQLKRHLNKQSHALDVDNDPDPTGEAARLHMIWHEGYKAEQQRNERRATLIIAKLDRLARNVHFISGLMESNVDFVAVDFPTANRLTVHILAAVAEHEAHMISERTKAALKAAKQRGRVSNSFTSHLNNTAMHSNNSADVCKEINHSFTELTPVV